MTRREFKVAKDRLEGLETNPANLPKVGLTTAFALLDTDWEWVNREQRVLQTEDGERYYDSRGILWDPEP